MSVRQLAALLGVVGFVIGVLIAIRPVWLLGSATGSGLAAGMFLTTLTFLITTSGREPSLGGFRARWRLRRTSSFLAGRQAYLDLSVPFPPPASGPA
jgi:hypothetical protein